MTRSRRHRSNNDHEITLSKATRSVPNNPDVRRAQLDVVEDPTPTSMADFAGAVVGAVDKNLQSRRPDIDSELESMHPGKVADIFGCGLKDNLEKTTRSEPLKIVIGKERDGSKKCAIATSKNARDVLLSNFKKEGKLSASNIIPPMQFHTNCWFNTMFMCMFVSDKGKKYMRFLRQLMIKGETLHGRAVTPNKLNEALILFNLAVEACYNLNKSAGNVGLALNTNNIIHSIYTSIPDSYKAKHKGIKDVDQYGNPYQFYRDLTSFLTEEDERTKLETIKSTEEVRDFFKGTYKTDADVIAVQLTDSGASGRASPEDAGSMPTSVVVARNTYELDSLVSRDISREHFCAGITINGKEYIFDGAAFSPLEKRTWRSKLGHDRPWGVSGSKNTWNLKRGYSLLLYYKTT